MEDISKQIVSAFQSHIDDKAIKKISFNVDRNELYEKYKSGEELNELERFFIMPLMNNDEEMNSLIDGSEILEKIYNKAINDYSDDVKRYKYNLMYEAETLHKEILESKYMLSTHELYNLVYKIGTNDCLVNIIDNLNELDYSKEDIEKIIGQSIDEKLTEYENKNRED